MNIKTQLLKGYIADYITKGIDDLSDMDAMEEIIEIMEEYNIYCGSRHDY